VRGGRGGRVYSFEFELGARRARLQGLDQTGFVANTPKDGQYAWGKGIVVGDAVYDASEDAYTGVQWTLSSIHFADEFLPEY
jgi:hypothetical protein